MDEYSIGAVVGFVAPDAPVALASPDPAQWRLAEAAAGFGAPDTPGLALARAGLSSWRPVDRVRRRIGRGARRVTIPVAAFGEYLFVNVAAEDFGAALAVMHEGRAVLRRVHDGRVPSAAIAGLRARWDEPAPGVPLAVLVRGDLVELRCGTAMPGARGTVEGTDGDAVRLTITLFGATIPARVPRGLLDKVEDGR